MKKYFLILFYSFLHNGKNRKEICIRSLFFIAILFIFSKLWEATGSGFESMIWYLSVTEMILISVPFVQVDIESAIRTGDIVYHLTRPIHFLWIKVFECMGAFLFRFLVLLLVSIPFCAYLSGYVLSFSTLILAYTMAILAGIVFILFHVSIGLLSFQLHDATPVFWIWQRCSFLFGGLLIPLNYYPHGLKTASYFLPFASLLYNPGRLIFDRSFVWMALAGLIFWGVMAVFLAQALYHRGLKSLKVNGG